MNKIRAGCLMAGASINLVQRLIKLGLIKDLIWPLLFIDLSNG